MQRAHLVHVDHARAVEHALARRSLFVAILAHLNTWLRRDRYHQIHPRTDNRLHDLLVEGDRAWWRTRRISSRQHRCRRRRRDGHCAAQSGQRGQAPGERAGCKRAGVLQVGRELFPERGEGCWEAWEVSCGVRKEAHIGAAALGFGLLGRAQQGAGARGCRGRVSLCWNPNRAVSPLSRARFRAQTRQGEAHTCAYWRSHASTCAFAREPPAGRTSLKVRPTFMRMMVFSFKICDCCACVWLVHIAVRGVRLRAHMALGTQSADRESVVPCSAEVGDPLVTPTRVFCGG